MKVIKIGGGCLRGKDNISHILEQVEQRGRGHVFVVSALNGVTDHLLNSMDKALEDEEQIPGIIGQLRQEHLGVAGYICADEEQLSSYARDLEYHLREIERLFYGLNFTREITLRLKDVVCSYGERLSAELLSFALNQKSVSATYCLPHKIGLLTDGKYGDATALVSKTSKLMPEHVQQLLEDKEIVIIPGFYGVSEQGEITTFGRGGSDYSAAVIAVALGAEVLEIWKDVAGYMSADPRYVPEAKLIQKLSYEEAAELSYFGAKILHPRTMEPLRRSKIAVSIRNTFKPETPGSVVSSRSPRVASVIKSVAHDQDIGILKVHGSGVGARPGILAQVASQLTTEGINIKSVVTSQTCISFLLAHKDLEAGRTALKGLRPKPFRRLGKVEDVSLVSIVGEGLAQRKGIAANCFEAVKNCGVNVEMISFGPSRVALYFLVRNKDLQKTLTSIHSMFFGTATRCA